MGQVEPLKQTERVTQQEAATLLGRSVRSLQRLVKQGRLTQTYERGRTRPTPLYERTQIEALQAELCNRPIYLQQRTGTEHSKKRPFGFRMAPEEIQRLSEEAASFGMLPSEYARHLVELGLESALRREVDRLCVQGTSLQSRIASLEEVVRGLREDFIETIAIVLEFTGMSADQAQQWAEDNLRPGDSLPAKTPVQKRRQ